tara:strand:- start:150 stop:1115 length:966 start_codon:yes stop_codon:yes gene_type:complete
MKKKENKIKRKLGMGLSSLLVKDEALASLVRKTGRPPKKIQPGGLKKNIKKFELQVNSTSNQTQIETHLLIPGMFQPRKNFNNMEIEELASSIKQNGILQPILVRPSKNEKMYEIIAGERRWRAAQIANLHQVPVIVRNFDDETALGVALVENLQRSDLNVVEEAEGYRLLMNKFSYTQEKLSNHLGKSRSHIANLLRLLTIPTKIKDYLINGKIGYAHVRTIMTLSEDQALEIMDEIIEKDLSVRVTENLVRRLKNKKITFEKSNYEDPNIVALQKELTTLLGLRVIIKNNLKNKGSLSIFYDSLDQLEPIIDKLKWRPK